MTIYFRFFQLTPAIMYREYTTQNESKPSRIPTLEVENTFYFEYNDTE